MKPLHAQPHPLAGQSLTLVTGSFAGCEFVLEDWWDRIGGQSWMDCTGNAACLEYAVRSVAERDPYFSNEVVYGKIGGAGKVVHVRHLPAGAPA